MKKYTYILFLLAHLSFFANAQFLRDSTINNENFPKKNILKTNPLAIFWGPTPFTAEYRLSLEHILSDKYSIQIGGSYLGKNCFVILGEASDTIPVYYVVKGFRLQLELKYYLNNVFSERKAPEGFYIAPTYSYSNSKLSDRYLNSQNKYIAFTYTYYCLKFGFQKTYKNLAIDFFTGGGYKDNLIVDYTTNKPKVLDYNEFVVFKNHIKILLGFNVGWAFD